MSSQRSMTSITEHVKDDETIDNITEFCDDYQSANKWLHMLSKQFAHQQLYEVQLKYTLKQNEYEPCTLNLKIVKDRVQAFNEEADDENEINNDPRKSEVEETKSIDAQTEINPDINYYELFNSQQFEHTVYAKCSDNLQPQLLAVALFESKY